MAPRKRRTRYTLHLLKEGVTANDIIRRPDATELEPARPLPYECRAFLIENEPKSPGWVRTLRSHFDLSHVLNQSNSFVMVLEVNGRSFAFTAGYGHTAIDRRFIEHGFGVRAAASVVDTDELTSWEDRTVTGNPRQRLTQLAHGGDRIALGVELDPRVVRRIAGTATAAGFVRVSGTDSASIGSYWNLEDLNKLCETLLEAYESDSWRDRFPELEALERLTRGDPLIEQLDEIVTARLDRRSTEMLGLAPLRVYGDELALFRVSGARGFEVDLDEGLSIQDLYASLPDDWDRPLRDLRIVPLNDTDEALDQPSRLKPYLVAEVELRGALYALTDGQWYRAHTDFLSQVQEGLAGIDITNELNLPSWPAGDEDEEAYNKRVGRKRGWRVIDKTNVYYPRRQKVEPCDLATPEGDLIYVKRGDNSPLISHLCKQAEIAADLLIDDVKFTTKLREMTGYDGSRIRERKIRFVIAVATDRPGSLADDLFLFSKLGLYQSRRLIERNLGFKLGLAKITRT